MKPDAARKLNPYEPSAISEQQKASPSEAVFQDSYGLPTNETSLLFVKRDHSSLASNAGKHSKYGPLLTHAKNNWVSSDHAELKFDPNEKKLTVTDLNSSYGTQVNYKDDDGNGLRNIFVFDIGQANEQHDRLSRFKGGFLEGRGPEDIKKEVVASLELDFSERWAITFGADAGPLQTGAFDRIVNDGNIIYHEQSFADEQGARTTSKRPLIVHNSFINKAQVEQAPAESKASSGGFFARLGLGKFKWGKGS